MNRQNLRAVPGRIGGVRGVWIAGLALALLALPGALAAQGNQGTGGDTGTTDSQDVLDQASRIYESARGGGAETMADSSRTYDPQGRRDPFRPLVGGIPEGDDQRGQLPGIAGLRFEEVQLVGIVQREAEPVAIFFGGPEEQGYFVRQGMNFYNGSVHQISPVRRSVVIRQQVDDPLKPYRDIDILLHPLEEE